MAFCTVCGWKYDGTPRFCQQCGTPLAPDAAAAAPTVAAPVVGGAYPPPAPAGTQTWTSEEHDLWTGKSIDMVTAGDLSPNHYRLTTRTLYFKHGRMGSVEKSVPLWAVKAVTLEQGLIDKARHVGTLLVHVEHDDWTEGINQVRLEEIPDAAQVRDMLLNQAREENYNYERRKQTMFYQGRPPIPPQ